MGPNPSRNPIHVAAGGLAGAGPHQANPTHCLPDQGPPTGSPMHSRCGWGIRCQVWVVYTRRITKLTKITWFEIHTTTHIIHQKCVYTNVIWIRNGIIGKEVSDV
jgi:hypothetical protein